MSFVLEKDIANYFPVTKNHLLSKIMMDIFTHILENRPMTHFEHSHLVKLEKQLSGSVPCFENPRQFCGWGNSLAKSISQYN